MTAQAELAVGAAVKLHSLQAKPELNGRSGLIVTALDTETGRFGVRVDGIDKPLALKAANLTAAAIGVKVTSQAGTHSIIDVALSVLTLTLLSPTACGIIHSVLHVPQIALRHLRPVSTSVTHPPILARTCVWSIWAWTLVCIRLCATTAAAYTALKATAHRGCGRAVWQEWAARRRHARARTDKRGQLERRAWTPMK